MVEIQLKIKMQKRAQITLFIIIGMVLILSVGVFLYYKSREQETALLFPTYLEIDKTTVTSYVESCLETIGRDVSEKIALQGGMYSPFFYRKYNGVNVSYWCYGEATNQCVNALFLKEEIAEQIIIGIREEISKCIDEHTFEEQGYSVEIGSLEGTALIARDSIDISLEYPIILEKDGEKITVDKFHAAFSSQLGELYDIAVYILNQEATKGIFDIVDFEINHTDIKLIKQKPYPAVIYSVQKVQKENNEKNDEENNELLQFAVQGIDTADNPGEILLGAGEPLYGCCYAGKEKSCYANTPSTVCSQKQGSYETAPCSCAPQSALELSKKTLCNGKECDGCGTKEHGESWCSYEGETGKGKDAVGARHTLYYCINGEIYEEPCRDYREEICVEKETLINNKKATKAICRPNQWQDCAVCTTKDCCQNTAARDCYWNEYLSGLERGKCVPYVPPGFKFWEFKGVEVCSRATQKKTCSGLYCSQEWVNAAAISCYSQGDCGNYRNTEGVLAENGFFSSNMKYEPDETIYSWDTKAEPITELRIFPDFQRPLLSQLHPLHESNVAETADIFVEMLTAAYRFVNQWIDITVPNYLNPFTKNPKIEVLEISICTPWQAPNTDKYCSECSTDGICTEYKCKSLGKKCLFEEKDGNPSCTSIPKAEKKKFNITIDASMMPSAYSIEQKTLSVYDKNYSGFKVTPALVPYKFFTIAVNTPIETICYLDYTPTLSYFDSSFLILGGAEYTLFHNLTIRVPPKIIIPEHLKESLNLTTAEALFSAIIAPKALLENYKEKFPAVFQVYTAVTGDDLAEELEPYIKKAQDFIASIEEDYPFYENLSLTLLDKWNNGGYYFFISCEDRYGNTAEEELFLEVDIANDTEDIAPSIVAFSPENNEKISADTTTKEVFLYTDEPAECRYDIEDNEYGSMEYAFICKNSYYNLVSVAGGSYECSTTLQTIQTTNHKPQITKDTTIFIRCADNPGIAETYLMAVQWSNTTGVEGRIYSASVPENVENPIDKYADYIYVKGDNETNSSEIHVSSYLLSDTYYTLFNTTSQNTTLYLYIDDERECTISEKTVSEEKLHCQETSEPEQHIGLYKCSAEISIEVPIEVPEEVPEEVHEEDNETSLFHELSEYEIICKKQAKQQNVNNESVSYTLIKSDGLYITGIGPRNNEEVKQETALTVTTSLSEDIQCGYAQYGYLEFVGMNKITETLFTALLSNLKTGYNTYTIYCHDAYGNSAEETVRFYVG